MENVENTTQSEVTEIVAEPTQQDVAEAKNKLNVSDRGIVLDDDKIKEIENIAKVAYDYMKANDAAAAETDDQKDEYYKFVTDQWNSLRDAVQAVRYNFYINYDEFDYLNKLLTQNMSYGVNDVFIGFKVKDGFLDYAQSEFDKYTNAKKNRQQNISFEVEMRDTIVLYHLLEGHKEKGLNKSSRLFSNVLKTIGDTNKVYNSLDLETKRLSEHIGNWMQGLIDKSDAVEIETEGTTSVN